VNLLKGKWVLDLYQPYDELEINSNEEEDEQYMPKTSNDCFKLIVQKEVEQKLELKHHGWEGLIKEKTSMQMMALILEEQVEIVMDDLLDDDDDYVDWLKWVGFENEWGVMTIGNSNMLALF
jgi:hypothetical protein